jgi:hypothetical protein
MPEYASQRSESMILTKAATRRGDGIIPVSNQR